MRTVNYYTRQGHKKALVYLKSGIYCDRREKQLDYTTVIISVALCFVGILFSILPRIILKDSTKFAFACEKTVDYLGIASGIFLVVQLIIKSMTTRLHAEAVSSIERFDNYVYDLPANRMILHPMTEAQFENYAAKVKSNDSEYLNPYFVNEVPSDPAVIYQNQREIFVNEYHLMLYVRRFSNIMCGLFAVFLLGFAIAADAEFLVTLQKIFFPSISIISILVTSFINLSKTMRFLQNVLTQYETNEKDSNFDRRAEIVLRQNQDAMFQYRVFCPTVPMFLIRRYEKSAFKRLRSALAEDDVCLPKTSLFITATQERKLASSKRTRSTKKPDVTDKVLADKVPDKAPGKIQGHAVKKTGKPDKDMEQAGKAPATKKKTNNTTKGTTKK